MTITLTQMLRQRRDLCLYGRKVSDLAPRGDLGLGLDAEGPIGFARVRAFRLGDECHTLAVPVVISVYGDGHPPEADDDLARSDERLWRATLDDAALLLDIRDGSLRHLLQSACEGWTG